jgi:hypothetical protein
MSLQPGGGGDSFELPQPPAFLLHPWIASCSTAVLVLDLTNHHVPAAAVGGAGFRPSHLRQQPQDPQWEGSNEASQEQQQWQEQLQVAHGMLLLAQAASGRTRACEAELGRLVEGPFDAAAASQQRLWPGVLHQQQQPQQQPLVPARNPLVDKLTAQVRRQVASGSNRLDLVIMLNMRDVDLKIGD